MLVYDTFVYFLVFVLWPLMFIHTAITSQVLTTQPNIERLPSSQKEPRSSCCCCNGRWKAAMSAEARPGKRWSLVEGKESETSANRGFLSCHSDLRLDWALSLYSALLHCMYRLSPQVSFIPELRELVTLRMAYMWLSTAQSRQQHLSFSLSLGNIKSNFKLWH